MSVFIFIIAIMALTGIISPIAKGIGRRISKGGPDSVDLKRLMAELEATEQRLADAERRLQLNEERLDFQEKLISSRPPAKLPPAAEDR